VSPAHAAAREAASRIVVAGRRLGTRGLISAGEGNLSIRLDDDTIAITPSGRRKDELIEDDVVIARLDGRERDARSASGLGPSSDLTIHLALYAARDDIGAVAHAHMPAALALTLGGEVPDPVALPETAYFIPRLPFVPFAEMGSLALATRIVDALTGPAPPADVALLERHGAVAVAADVATAVDRLELVEVLCRTWRDSLLVRAARIALDRSRGRSSGTGPTG
jgi:L-fuculose-phosphate aldolase